MLKLARDWLLRAWWGSLVAYPILFTAAYLAIWAAIEPLDIPETLPAFLWPFNTRWFFHVALAIFLAAHASLALDLWLRRGLWPPVARSDVVATMVSISALNSREAIYGAAVKAIGAAEVDSTAPRILFLGALHGHSGQRRLSRGASNPTFAEFDNALLRCVKSTGPGMWRVRELYNIVGFERLEEIEGWLRQTASEDGYEVRAFCERSAIAHLAPLVVSDRDLFLGLEDDRYFRVQAGVHIKDHDAAAVVLRYCDALWNDQRVFKLRTGYGVDEGELRKLRARIAQIPKDV